MARIDQTVRGTPIELSWRPVLVLVAFVDRACRALSRGGWRACARIGRSAPRARHAPLAGGDRHDGRCLRFFATSSAVSSRCGRSSRCWSSAVAIYAVFYPQPYLNEALRNVPIAVVDRDGTQASRDLARRVDATPDVAVAMLLPDLAERGARGLRAHDLRHPGDPASTSSATSCTAGLRRSRSMPTPAIS